VELRSDAVVRANRLARVCSWWDWSLGTVKRNRRSAPREKGNPRQSLGSRGVPACWDTGINGIISSSGSFCWCEAVVTMARASERTADDKLRERLGSQSQTEYFGVWSGVVSGESVESDWNSPEETLGSF
jgi:hypothetical protein